MKTKFWRGEWWLPETPEIQASGQLIVDVNGKCRLEIVGSLNLEAVAVKQAASPRTGAAVERVSAIHGSARGIPITLLNCFTTSSDGLSPTSRSYQDVHVHEALIGAHVAHDEPAFTSAIVEIEDLTSSLAHAELIARAEDGDSEHATTRRPPDISCVVDGWKITAKGAGATLPGKRETVPPLGGGRSVDVPGAYPACAGRSECVSRHGARAHRPHHTRRRRGPGSDQPDANPSQPDDHARARRDSV